MSTLKNLVRSLSFTSALFVFQACYGTPQDMKEDIYLEGVIRSALNGEPIPGIRIMALHSMQEEYTNSEGRFSMYLIPADSLKLRIDDPDGALNGSFLPKDTILTVEDNYVFFETELNAQ